MNKILASCSKCGYPIAISRGGDLNPFCPNCNSKTSIRVAATLPVTVNPWALVLAGVVGFSVGYVVGKKGK